MPSPRLRGRSLDKPNEPIHSGAAKTWPSPKPSRLTTLPSDGEGNHDGRGRMVPVFWSMPGFMNKRAVYTTSPQTTSTAHFGRAVRKLWP